MPCQQLFVDSRDRCSGVSCDFQIQLAQTLSLEGKARGRIDSLRIPLTIPTIRTGVNDTLRIFLNGTNYTVGVPQGQYDGPGLASAIQGLLQTYIPGQWVCTYDVSNLTLTIRGSPGL